MVVVGEIVPGHAHTLIYSVLTAACTRCGFRVYRTAREIASSEGSRGAVKATVTRG